jgi:hypothetical protein
MTQDARLRRLIYAFLLAVLGAVLLSLVEAHAQTTKPKPTTQGDVLVPCPDCGKTFCDTWEPYGWFWFFFNCGAK